MAYNNQSSPPSRTSWIPRDNDIPSLKTELAKFHCLDKINKRQFESMRDGMMGLSDITVGKLALQAIVASPKQDGEAPKTYLISDKPMEFLYEIPALMGVNLKKNMSIADDSGKKRYVFQITPLALSMLRSLADKEAMRKPPKSLIPPAQVDANPEVELVRSRLDMMIVVSSTDPEFDDGKLRMLSADLKCVMMFRDETGKSYYYLVVGDDEREAYRLYIDNSPEETENFVSTISLMRGERYFLLCREI